MTPKQRVLRRFPSAVSHYSLSERVWFVWASPKPLGAQELIGRDANAARAWRYAAEVVCPPTRCRA